MRKVISILCVLFVSGPVAGSANSCLAQFADLFCGERSVSDLSGDELKSLFACVDLPSETAEYDTPLNFCEYAPGDALLTVDLSLLKQRVDLNVLRDADHNETRYRLSVATAILGLVPGDFHFDNGHLLGSAWQDLVGFIGDRQYHQTFADFSETYWPTSEEEAANTEDSPLPESLAAIALYGSAYADATGYLIEGIYGDFFTSESVSYSYEGTNYSSRLHPAANGLSILQETLDSITAGDAALWSDSPEFAHLVYVLRSAFNTEGDKGYLANPHGQSGGTIADALYAMTEAGLNLSDALAAEYEARGLTDSESAAPKSCPASDTGFPTDYEISASQIFLADTLAGFASDPASGVDENPLQSAIEGYLCAPQSGDTDLCTDEATASSYYAVLQEALVSTVLNQEDNPDFAFHDAAGSALRDGFLSASNLRSALDRVNQSVWSVIDAFSALPSSEDDGSTATCTDCEACPYYHTADTEDEDGLNDIYSFLIEVSAFQEDENWYQWMKNHFAADNMDDYSNMSTYLDSFKPLLEACGWDEDIRPAALAEQLCPVIWDYSKPPIRAGYKGNYSDLYLNDIEAMLLDAAVAKSFSAYASAGHSFFYGLSSKDFDSNGVTNDYDAICEMAYLYDTSSRAPGGETDNSSDNSDTEASLAELTATDNPALDQFEILMGYLYTPGTDADTPWQATDTLLSLIDGLRALITENPTDPLSAVFPPLYRLATLTSPTSDLDALFRDSSDLLTDCKSEMNYALSRFTLATDYFVSDYAKVIFPAEEDTGEESGSFESYRASLEPFLIDPQSLFDTGVALKDPGWFHFLFRDKDKSGKQLETPLRWVKFNVVDSHLLDYAEAALKFLFDASVYPHYFIEGKPMDEVNGEVSGE